MIWSKVIIFFRTFYACMWYKWIFRNLIKYMFITVCFFSFKGIYLIKYMSSRLVTKHIGICIHVINSYAVMIWCGRNYTSKMRSVDVFKYCSFVTFGLSRDEAESWRPPMSIPELQRWFDDLVGLRSNLSQGWINRMGRFSTRMNQRKRIS